MALLTKDRTTKRWGNLLKRGWTSGFLARDQLIGLDIGSRAVKLVQMREAQGRWQLQRFQVEFLSSGVGVNEGIVEEGQVLTVIKDLFREIRSQEIRVATSISGPSVIIKSLEVPTMSRDELEGHLEWEIDHYIPYDLQDIYWDYYIPYSQDAKTSSPMTVRLVAAKREIVDQRTELLKRAGLEPTVLDVDNFALANMYALNYGEREKEKELMVNIGPSGLNMTMMSKGMPNYLRDTPIGVEWYRAGLQQFYQDTTVDTEPGGPKKVDKGENLHFHLEEVYQEVTSEIRRTIEYNQGGEPGQKVQYLLLCGGYARLPGLADYIRNQLNLSVEVGDPFRKLDISSIEENRDTLQNLAPLAGVAVGLALRKAGDR